MYDDALGDDAPPAVGGPAVVGAPSPALAAHLDATDLTAVDDATLVEVVAGWRRLQSWAAGRTALAAAALAERASMNPAWPDVAGRVSEPCVAAEELAMRLGCSRRAARDLVRAGKAYDGVLWPTGAALLAGELDEAKARVLLRALEPVAGPIALDVQDEVLPRAARRTLAQLDADVQRALVRVDPDEAAERAALAASGRRVCRPRVLPDGMAGIWAVLPAPAAVALHHELGAVAAAAQRAGDGRTFDQLRADALCCAVLARGDAGDADASGDGAGPDVLSRLLAGPTLDAEIQVVVPMDVLLGVSDGAAELRGYGAIAPATAEALAQGGTWRRLVTDPLSGTVLDVGRTRYRPPPGLAAHVRTRDGTCVRPGCPSSAARCELDHTVPFVAPDERASRGVGGPTADENLGCLCKRDHLVKTHGGFVLRQVAPGVFEWTTPAGHRYVERRTAFGPVPLELGDTPGPTLDDAQRRAPGDARWSTDGRSDDSAPPTRWDRPATLENPGPPPSPLLGPSGRPTEVKGPDGVTRESARVGVRPHRPGRGRRRGAGPPPF